MAAMPGSPQRKPSPAARSGPDWRRRLPDWSGYLLFGGLVALSLSPFVVVLIVLDVILGQDVRIVHRIASPLEWIVAGAIGLAFLAAGIWLVVVSTRAVIQEAVDIVRSKRSTGTVSQFIGRRSDGPERETFTDEWDVEFTDSTGQHRTARYSTSPGGRNPTALGTPIRVRYRPDRPDDQARMALRRTGTAHLIGYVLLRIVGLALWLVMLSPLFGLLYSLAHYL